uniref:Uncharacterized protein n=1 Tax=Bos indicus x Bos taurus TaxID=30522 RepID=A0A4W2ERV5_BOBOX
MAPRVPGARSQVRGGPAPQRATSAGATLSLSRGGGGRGNPPGAGRRTFRTPAQPPAHLGGTALPWAPGGAACGDRGYPTRVPEGRHHLAPTLRAAPRKV